MAKSFFSDFPKKLKLQILLVPSKQNNAALYNVKYYWRQWKCLGLLLLAD